VKNCRGPGLKRFFAVIRPVGLPQPGPMDSMAEQGGCAGLPSWAMQELGGGCGMQRTWAIGQVDNRAWLACLPWGLHAEANGREPRRTPPGGRPRPSDVRPAAQLHAGDLQREPHANSLSIQFEPANPHQAPPPARPQAAGTHPCGPQCGSAHPPATADAQCRRAGRFRFSRPGFGFGGDEPKRGWSNAHTRTALRVRGRRQSRPGLHLTLTAPQGVHHGFSPSLSPAIGPGKISGP